MIQQLLQKAHEKGTTEQFEAYVRLFPSCLTNDYKEYLHGEGRSVFAHVRKDAGIAYKPPFSGVPLTQQQHHNQHQYGYEHYNPIDWWERKAIEYLCKWINNDPVPQLPEKRTKETFNIESVSHLKAIEEMLTDYFKNPKAKPINITIETDTRKRSIQQNKAQWGVIYNNLGQFYCQNQTAFGMDMVRSIQEYPPTNDEIHAMCKRLHNDNQSTATLKVGTHCTYFENIQNHLTDKYEFQLTMPVSPYDYY